MREIQHVAEALRSNGYPLRLIKDTINGQQRREKRVAKPEDLVGIFFAWVDPDKSPNGYATLPYITGLTEPLTRTQRKHCIIGTNKPTKTLQQEFPLAKDRPVQDKQTNVVYKIDCKDGD